MAFSAPTPDPTGEEDPLLGPAHVAAGGPLQPSAADELCVVGASAGLTIGLEEEFHVLDAETGELAPHAPGRLAANAADESLAAELLSSTVETATEVCRSLDDLREELVKQRRALCAAAERAGVV